MATQREQKSTCVVADLTAVRDHVIGHVISVISSDGEGTTR